ncbi:hypothetical protein QBC38DRAFT_446651 [Podospora fimiseda]|uniref:Uncharacterized protein n=1 Tax=Podospora fimiseda TaxID=252190 RepID=A0AAN7GZK8_9PEZI|nr:hypothetical protein QBC38DRAFT_446651 [Podospora fimiseda]
MSYPAFTYEELLFPPVPLKTFPVDEASYDSFKLTSTLPTLRSTMDCKQYDSSMIQLYYSSFFHAPIAYEEKNPANERIVPAKIFAHISPEDTGDKARPEEAPHFMLWNNKTRKQLDWETSSLPEKTKCVGYFDLDKYASLYKQFASVMVGVGGSASNQRNTNDYTYTFNDYTEHNLIDCKSDLVCIWGNLSASLEWVNPMTEISLSALGCNESLELVDARVQLLGPKLELDPHVAPTIIEGRSSKRVLLSMPLNAAGMLENIYQEKVPMTYPSDLLDGFFQLLLPSNSSVSMPTLSDTNVEARTTDLGNHRSAFVYDAKSTDPAIMLGNATFTLLGRTRVSQDPSSTRSLQAAFGAITLLLIIGWTLNLVSMDPEIQKFPFHDRSPTNIAGVMALLADSNFFEFLPPEWELPSPRKSKKSGCNVFFEAGKTQLEEGFRGFRFKLGWRTVKGPKNEKGWQRVFTLIVVPEGEETTSGLGSVLDSHLNQGLQMVGGTTGGASRGDPKSFR